MLRFLTLILFFTVYNYQTVPPPTASPSTDENEVKRLLVLYTDAMVMDWNAAGTLIATVSPRSTVRMWNAETLQQLYFVRTNTGLNGIQFNASGDRFFTWASREIRLWETATGHLLGTLPAPSNSKFEGVAWQGNYLLNWFGGTIGLWDGYAPENIAEVLVPDESFTPFHANISWTIDRSRFLTWNGLHVEAPLVRVWAVNGQLDSLTQLMTLQHGDEYIDGAAWSPDERLIASWSQKMVKVWDAATGELQQLLNTDGYVTVAQWSPNSRYLLVEDIRANAARVWDVDTGDEVLTLAVIDALWDTTGERLLVGRQNISLIEVATGVKLTEFGPRLGLGYGLWNPDGVRLLVETAFGVQVWIIPSQTQCVLHALAPTNLRAKPSTNAASMDVLPIRRMVSVVDQIRGPDDLIWWQIDSGLWVRSDVVEETGACFAMGQ